MSTEITVEAAMARLRQDYWDDVRSVADDCVTEAKERFAEGDSHLREWLVERVDEICDGSRRVFMTGEAILCLLFSDNDSAMIDEMGDASGAVDGGSINFAALAFWAFRADVMAQLDALLPDINDDDLGFEPDDDDDEAADDSADD